MHRRGVNLLAVIVALCSLFLFTACANAGRWSDVHDCESQVLGRYVYQRTEWVRDRLRRGIRTRDNAVPPFYSLTLLPDCTFVREFEAGEKEYDRSTGAWDRRGCAVTLYSLTPDGRAATETWLVRGRSFTRVEIDEAPESDNYTWYVLTRQ